MTVTDHVVEIDDGFQLCFTAEDMKDQKPRRFPLACDLVEPMQLYLDLYRPLLLGDKQSDGLWISHLGKPLLADGYARDLPRITERHLGVALRPHAFRHIAATSIAEVDPEHVGIIRDVLGHATLDMAEKHYNRASANSACNKLQSVVGDIRRKAARMSDIARLIEGLRAVAEDASEWVPPKKVGKRRSEALRMWVANAHLIWTELLGRPFTRDALSNGEPVCAANRN